MKKRGFSISFDRKDVLLCHHSIISIDPKAVGLIQIHETSATRKGIAPKTLHLAHGNIREELEKASKIATISRLPYVHFSYKTKITVKQYQNLRRRLR